MVDYRLFPTNPTPSTPDGGSSSAITAGLRFKVTAAATATTIWFYKAATNTGTHVGAIWNDAGTLQGQVTFSGETASGWQSATFPTPIALTVGDYYRAGVFMPAGHFSRDASYFATSHASGPLYAPSNAESSPQSCFSAAAAAVSLMDAYSATTITSTSGRTVAQEFWSDEATTISQIGIYAGDSGVYECYVWDMAGSVLAGPGTGTSPASAGWFWINVSAAVAAGQHFKVGYFSPSGRTQWYLDSMLGAGASYVNLPLHSADPSNSFGWRTSGAGAVQNPNTRTALWYGMAVKIGGSAELAFPDEWESTDSYGVDVSVTAEAPPEPTPTVRRLSSTITFAGVEVADVISARGQVAADSGWPTCSVFVTAKPETGNEEDDLEVVAGAGTNVTRFVGKVRRFKPSAFPKGIEMVATGTLAYADEWAPDTDLIFDEEFPAGATDQTLVTWALGFVPGISYVGADIQGTGITLGTEAPEAFDWHAGVSAWQYVQQLDRATLYRTYQQHDGTIRRVQMIGHPSSTTTSFTLANADILEGSTGSRNTEQTRNAAIVRGHDYGDGLGPVLGAAYGSNDFQGAGATAATRHPESFSSDLIEDGNDEDGTPLGYGGIDAQDVADAILNDVNKEFVTADIRSWRDDEHGPGLTCLLDTLDRLAIGEKMWVQGYAWEVDDGWSASYSLSGGGLEQPYTPPPV